MYSVLSEYHAASVVQPGRWQRSAVLWGFFDTRATQVEDVDIDGVWESEVVLQGYRIFLFVRINYAFSLLVLAGH